jgi:hypothetical protein
MVNQLDQNQSCQKKSWENCGYSVLIKWGVDQHYKTYSIGTQCIKG